MDKQTIFGTVALMVIILGVVLYAAMRPVPAKAPPASMTLPELTYTEQAPYYDISAFYASSTSLREPANTAAVKLMRDFVANTITQFKTDGNFDNLTAADIKMMGFDTGRKETLKIVYLMSSSARTVSYIYTIYTDTLGAHGNTDFTTFTFDTSTGALLKLSDIFLPPADNYLGSLVKLSRARLPTIIGDGYNMADIQDGTLPDPDNYKNFFFDNTDFVVLFPPYQVASYAAGPQTLRIPVSLLSSILKSEYR